MNVNRRELLATIGATAAAAATAGFTATARGFAANETITVDACAAGKDVYVEKPLTHDLSEGVRVIEAQNRSSRIVQVGTQQRSMPHLRKAYEIVKSGQLGEIHKVHLTWNRNAPRSARPNLNIDPKTVDWKQFLGTAKDQPFDDYRFRQWR